MFSKGKEQVAGGKIDTIIGNGSSFNGSLNVEGTLRIDGTVEGEIKINGDVIIGKTGLLRASVKGHNVTVAGQVHGNIILDGKLEISSTGKVTGDIEVAKLVISEGAVFKGKSSMHKGERSTEKGLPFIGKKNESKGEKKGKSEQ